MADRHYQARAERLVDVLHDAGWLHPDLTREAARKLEGFIAEDYQQIGDQTERMLRLTEQLKKIDRKVNDRAPTRAAESEGA